MTVDRSISIDIVNRELAECILDAARYNWDISPIDDDQMSFQVRMVSPIDKEPYVIQFEFRDYREKPLLIEFIDPKTNLPGTKQAYPRSRSNGFFHSMPCICHPCSRKAYAQFSGPHQDWTLTGWETNPKVGTLTTIRAILRAINARITDPELYGGRMLGP